ncbi:MAG: Imm50 family immunity protein [Planctomycetota bacterium]
MDIPGADNLIKVFGRWPSFHDAEVVRFLIERVKPFGAGPGIVADIHVFEMTDQVAADGTYIRKHDSLVSFRFAGVDQVVLENFNNQNVLWDLAITDIRDRQIEDLKYEINFASSFGIGAHFLCREVMIERVRPWEGPDGNAR